VSVWDAVPSPRVRWHTRASKRVQLPKASARGRVQALLDVAARAVASLRRIAPLRAFDTRLRPSASRPQALVCYRALRRLPGRDFHPAGAVQHGTPSSAELPASRSPSTSSGPRRVRWCDQARARAVEFDQEQLHRARSPARKRPARPDAAVHQRLPEVLSQNSSMDFTTKMNRSRSTGLVM
jgi:hypothetical protein